MFGMDAATSNAITNVAICVVVIVFIIACAVVVVKRGWPTKTDLSALLDREPMWKSETTTTYGPSKEGERQEDKTS